MTEGTGRQAMAIPPDPAERTLSAAARKRIMFSSNAAWNLVNYRGGLIQALLAAGHEIVALAPEDRHAQTLIHWGCHFVPLRMSAAGLSPLGEIALFNRFRQIFRAYSPDIVFSYTIKNNIWGALAARRTNTRLIPNVSGLGSAFQSKAWLRDLVTALYRIAFRDLPLVFFQNADDEALFVKLRIVRAETAARLPGSGVDLASFNVAPLPGDDSRVTFLLISRMLWEKGVGEFVEAARLIRREHPDARFQLLGFLDVQNPSAISAQQMADWVRDGQIEYLGTTDDVRGPIGNADCVVLPTAYGEGTPRALLEASAMGRPIIATNVSGCREVLREGENGFMCLPSNSPSLATACRRFISMGPAGRAEMGRNARRVVEAEYDEKQVIAAYISALAYAK